MTREAMLKAMQKLEVTDTESAMAAFFPCWSKAAAVGDPLQLHRQTTILDRVILGLFYSEFIADSSDERDLWAAARNARWLRRKLGLDEADLSRQMERLGFGMACT